MLMIERRGTTMTIASSLAPQSTFEANGPEGLKQLSNGRWTKVIATLRGEQLLVSSNGYKENDFNVTFDASENDRSLLVRRQIYSDKLTQPVVVDSVYDRTADVAQWNVDKDSRPVLGNASIITLALSSRSRGAIPQFHPFHPERFPYYLLDYHSRKAESRFPLKGF